MIVFAVILGLITLAAFFGNLLVLLVVKIYESFHYIRYFLLASLALSDLLFTVMIISNSSSQHISPGRFTLALCSIFASCLMRDTGPSLKILSTIPVALQRNAPF